MRARGTDVAALERAPEVAPGGGPMRARAARTDRVMFLSVSGGLGGAERALLDMVASLRGVDDRWPIEVLLAGPGPLADELRKHGVDVVVLPMPAALLSMGDSSASASGTVAGVLARAALNLPRLIAYVWRLRRTLQERRPAIVHSNGFKMHVLGALARPGGALLVWHLHDYTTPRAVMARVLRFLAPRCDAAIANSASVAADARRALGPSFPVETVYNAVDLDRFANARAADLAGAAGMPPVPRGTVQIGLVATMAWWKGHDVFLRALARVRSTTDWRAYVIGGTVYDTASRQHSVEELRALAREQGIAGRVGFTGFVRDASTVMAALDIVVHASTQPEPFGLVIAEAMAARRAVVVSAAGGAAELVVDGETALTHAPGDEDALAAALQRLLDDPSLRERLATAARHSAEARFARARLGAELAKVYASVQRNRP